MNAESTKLQRLHKATSTTAAGLSIIRCVVANDQSLTILIFCFLEYIFIIFQFIFNQVSLVFLYSWFRVFYLTCAYTDVRDGKHLYSNQDTVILTFSTSSRYRGQLF